MAFYCRLISREPFVIIAGTGNGMLGPAWPMRDTLPDRCYILINFWTHFAHNTAKNLHYELNDYQKLYPGRKVLFLANELSQLQELRALGLSTIMGNHNIFIDENIFKPKNHGRLREFDAIYNARMNAEKHHELCQNIKSVSLIYYFNPAKDFTYFNQVRMLLPRARFLNGDPQDQSYRHFTPEECARYEAYPVVPGSPISSGYTIWAG